MSHNSAPHNLTEVCNAIVATIEKGSPLTIDELLEKLPGPDFPLGGTILNIKDIKPAFMTGKSKISLKIQGDYEIDGQKIIFTSIPYRTYRNKIKEQINESIEELSEVIDDFDDESNVGKNRLVFHVKSGVAPAEALTKLFALTDLQSTLSYNMNYIVNGTPRMCSMNDLIKAYITHQENVTIRAFTYDMEKALARIHILEGLIKAVNKIDEVIALIKQSESRAEARTKLIDFLVIDEDQANAILDMKLGKLTRIDKEELINEQDEKIKFVAYCKSIIYDYDARIDYIKGKVIELRDKYGDTRRTKLMNVEIQKPTKEKPVVEPKDCVVIITKSNMVKRVDKKNFKPQKRNTAGVKTNGDIVAYSVSTNTEDALLIFSTRGKMYRLVIDAIPEGTNTSAGVALSSLVKFDNNDYPITYTTLNKDAGNYIFFATKNGIVKKVPFEEYEKTKRSGILAINLKEGDELADVALLSAEDIGLVTQNGMFIRFKTDGMPISSRIAQGVKGIALNDGDAVLKALPISPAANYLALVSKDGQGKKVSLSEFTTQGRAGKGVICSKLPVAGAALLGDNDNLLVSGDKTSIVVDGAEIPVLGRTAQGVSMIKNNMEVVSISKI